ncbi:MAG: ribose 5-phosphate isomerase B [Alphaproteobacteria bacterium]|jgi:ribose 5-phosphate isomerase B|nr:ribose 5-phosphate isomerase B [Alphaproteobacteria bacterium]MBT5389882.1 ribose 5-phosphate isomerase B [Alphaproteobacteria bacterium]
MERHKIAIGSDHAGFELKEKLLKDLIANGYSVTDCGTKNGSTSVDYPDYAHKVSELITNGTVTRGILVCGTGIGMSIAANRHASIRAAMCQSCTAARLSRSHNDANILTLGARIIGEEVAKDCITTFLETPFEGERHQSRIEKLTIL